MDINYGLILVVGLATLFVGYLVGLFEGRGKEKPNEKTKSPAVPSVPAAPKENNLLKLSRDNDQLLRLEMDGQRADANQLTPEQRKRLIDLMVMMRPWIDASAPKSVAPPAASMAAAPVSQPISKPLSASPIALVTKDVKSGPTTMVGQIDEILQTNLADSSLANRAIRLMESPGGGVVVMVGLDKYDGVGDVPDPQVQAAIRAAIAEWEKKYTPGG